MNTSIENNNGFKRPSKFINNTLNDGARSIMRKVMHNNKEANRTFD